MIELISTDNKVFMNHILKKDSFDKFLMKKFELDAQISYRIFGELVEDSSKNITWGEVREDIYHIVKNKKTPTAMKFVFGLNEELSQALAGDDYDSINGFSLSILFDGKDIKVLTGVNYKAFILDKTAEKKFDDSIHKFFLKKDIPVK